MGLGFVLITREEEVFGGERGGSLGRQLTSTASDVLRPDDAWRPRVTRQLGDVCWHIACRIAAAASAATALLTRIAQNCFTITSATTRPFCAESAARRLAVTCHAATDASWGSCTDTPRENETGGDVGGGEGNGGGGGKGGGGGGGGEADGEPAGGQPESKESAPDHSTISAIILEQLSAQQAVSDAGASTESSAL